MYKKINELYDVFKNNKQTNFDSTFVNWQDKNGDTLINYAVHKNDVETVNKLIGCDADPMIRNNNGMNAMSLSSSVENVEIIESLINNYHKYLSNYDKLEMLAYAVANNAVANVNVMLEKGFVPLGTFRNDPIIIWAIQSENADLINLLLENGSLVDSSDESGQTALYTAAAEGYYDIVSLLIKKKAQIDKADKRGNTPLAIACCYNHFEVVKLLVGCGANVNSKNQDNCTPLLFAVKYENIDIVRFLIKSGADISTKNSNNLGVFDYIAEIKDVDVKNEMSKLIS